MAWNTGSNSPGEAPTMLRTSVVAFCCSNASSRSRVRRAISVFKLVASERPGTAFADRRRFGVALWRPALSGLPPIFERFIALPRLRAKYLRGRSKVPEVASRSAHIGLSDFRKRSFASILVSSRYVRSGGDLGILRNWEDEYFSQTSCTNQIVFGFT